MAQRGPKADISSLEFDDIRSPDLAGAANVKNKSWKPKEWLEVEAGIKLPAMSKEQEDSGFIDRIVIKWYVAITDKATKKPVLLTKDIVHINVPVDEEFFTSVYLSPSTIKRLTGKDRASKSQVEVVALEVIANNIKVGEETTDHKSGWWNSPSLARGDRFPLLNKNETPFKFLWWDRYAEIEEER